MPISLAAAIGEIDPKMEYRLNHSVGDGTQVILEWRGPGPQPTQLELEEAWATVEDRLAVEAAAEVQKEADRQAAISELSKTPEGQQILKAVGITPV